MKCPECGKPAQNDIDGKFCTWCPWEEYDFVDDYTMKDYDAYDGIEEGIYEDGY